MENPGKILISLGAVLIVVGALWQWGGRFFPFGKLPGDISVQKENFSFHFPLMSSIILSVVLSIALWIFQYFKK